MARRFQWPCWLLDLAWDWQATPHPADRRFSNRVQRALKGMRRAEWWAAERVEADEPADVGTCPRAFIPRKDGNTDCHVCTCDQPDGHVKQGLLHHHCPDEDCDVWWTLQSEREAAAR